MAEIFDWIIAIAWIWVYLIAILAALSGVLFIVAILAYRPAQDRVDRVRPFSTSEPETLDKDRRSKLTADLL
jgi:hypothetical protein